MSLSGFGIRVIIASWNEFASVSSSAVFLINHYSSLYDWWNSPVKSSGSELLFAEKFFFFN